VPILAAWNLGKHLSIDDKNIKGEGYTIIANKETGKIVLMIMTRKAQIICDVLGKIPLKLRLGVETISKDLAQNYDWVSRTMFPHAIRIADKFHVLKLMFDALQAIRTKERQKILTEEREAYEAEKVLAKKENRKTQRIVYKRFSNGETKKEILARGRWLLFKKSEDWTPSQEARSKLLFELFPEIKTAYDYFLIFRKIYDYTDLEKARPELDKWIHDGKNINISEVKNFVSSIERNLPEILAYFSTLQTNAFAESLNAKIQRFVTSAFGFNDRDLFHFRLRIFFSSQPEPSK
jgi:transposase